MSNRFALQLWDRMDRCFARDTADMSYADWVTQHTTLRGRPFSMRGYEFQEAILNDMHPTLVCKKCSQVGLALDVSTPIRTTTGWTTMQDVQSGDWLFDERGFPCQVTYVSPIYENRDCYLITFDDGQEIVADGEHRWYVECDKPFKGGEFFSKQGRPANNSGFHKDGIIKTHELFKNYKTPGRNNFAIPNTLPLQQPEKLLPIHPYALGLWLGDGNSHHNTITCHKNDFEVYKQILQSRGIQFRLSNVVEDTRQFTLLRADGSTLYSEFAKLELLKNKHIPSIYLHASTPQRFELLAGLMDTDGTITKNGRLSFYNTNNKLVEQFCELIASLGFKYRIRWRLNSSSVMKNGHTITPKKPVAEVSFVSYAGCNVFQLPRKASRLKKADNCRVTETTRRRIVEVKQVETRPVRCLTVNSESHLFLAGKAMIPTHNTEVQIRKALAFVKRNRGVNAIFTIAEEKLFKKVSQSRILPIVKHDQVFNTEEDEGSVRSMGIIQFGHSFLYVTACTEGDATSTPADALFKDEVDLSPQDMLALLSSRLQNSSYKINQEFSTPTFPGYGIDSSFENTDQRLYKVKCTSCNHWNWPTFTRNFIHLPGLPDHIEHLVDIDATALDSIDMLNAFIHCEKCKRALDLGNPALREWVPTYPTRSNQGHGYWVSPFSTDRLDVRYIIGQLLSYKSRQFVRGFHNTVLGQTYTDGLMQLTEQAIRSALDKGQGAMPDIGADRPVTVGIDMGQTCHITVMDAKTKNYLLFLAIHVDELHDWVKGFLLTHKVVAGAIDRHPYTPTSNAIRDLSKGVIIPVEYTPRGPSFSFVYEPADPTLLSHVKGNRTMMLDDFAGRVRSGAVSFSGYTSYADTIVDHLRGMWRDEKPEEPATWRKFHNRDHFFHSASYAYAALKILEIEESQMDSESRSTVLANIVPLAQNSNLVLQNRSGRRYAPPLGFMR